MEGAAHHRLKAYVAANPALVGLPRATPPGQVEYALPSADRIDVLFATRHERVAVEVKAANAGPGDLLRGLFQCVKYEVLLRAEVVVRDVAPAARAMLVLEGVLPAELAAVRHALGVTVFERIVPDA